MATNIEGGDTMGLKTVNYNVTKVGIILENAYAKVVQLEVDKLGNAKALIGVQQSREDVESHELLEEHEVNFVVDKTKNIFDQAYIKAKETVFAGWEDDNPLEVVIEEIPQA